jgi:membrane protein DedA with SNARE-associated domain
LAEFVSIYGIWVVAAFIALESVGIPLPAEAALIAAGFFAARTQGLDIWSLIAAGIVAAVFGEIVGFWIGRTFGHQLLTRYGARLGFTEGRIKIGQWLFMRYGGRFVFIAHFCATWLPCLPVRIPCRSIVFTSRAGRRRRLGS